MEDKSCVSFLQWALPRLHLQWRGFRKVRRQVCRRIDKRIAELGFTSLDSYKKFLRADEEEWRVLDHFCRITISRFYRDRVVFDYLGSAALQDLAGSLRKKRATTMRAWSVGCASGEEAYTLALLWFFVIKPQFPGLRLEITASDIDPVVLKRGEAACYSISSLKNVPSLWLNEAFERKNDLFCLQAPFKKYVRFTLSDIRQQEAPQGLFDIILCRNLVFTYFDRTLQLQVIDLLYEKMTPGALLVTGSHEQPPAGAIGFKPVLRNLPIYQKQEKT